MKNKLTAFQEIQLCNLYQTGFTGQELELEFCISHRTVVNTLRKYDITVRNNIDYARLRHTKKDINEFLRLYKAGGSLGQCYKDTKISYKYANYLLQNAGIKKRGRTEQLRITKNTVTKAQEKRLITEYKNSGSRVKAGAVVGVSQTAALRVLLQNNIPVKRMNHKHYTLDETVFDVITPESAYWIGFLMADGCITKRGKAYRISLCLSAIDSQHVYLFRRFLKSNHKVGKGAVYLHGKKFLTASLVVTSKKLAFVLRKYGVVERKSKIASVRYLEDSIDFWRGMMDGDGTVNLYNAQPRIALCGGSSVLLQQFEKFVKKRLVTNAHIHHSAKGVFVFSLGGKPAVQLIKILYKDCSIALPRKLKSAKFAISLTGDTL